jgi:multimeric flavodoxin WrbA
MRILAIVASPRKGGNTDILVQEMLKGAGSKDHSTEKIHLYDFNILPCIDCRGCKKSESGFNCLLSDDMQHLYEKLTEADVIVFGTPIYWYGPTAKMKLLIDRLRPFIASRKLSGKMGVLVVPSEEGPDCCGPLMQMFMMSFDYLGMQMAGSILASAYERGEVKNNPADLLKAFEFGMCLHMS